MIENNQPLRTGVHAALVVPLRPDETIDEAAYVQELDFVLSAPGITGLLVNGHAGENTTTTDSEKERIVRITRSRAPANLSVTSGVYSESSAHAAVQARRMEAAGADAILVFQPFSWALGAERSTILTHHRIIHDAVGLPLVLYQAPTTMGRLAYAPEAILDLIGLERVLGVKDGSWEIATSEIVRDLIKARRPEVMVMGSGDEHLMLSYFLGTDGSQVSLAAVTPDLVCRLWNAAQAADWSEARDCHARLQPLARLIYRRSPSSRSVPRLKACLTILGVIQSDCVRSPMRPIPPEEYVELEAALKACH